MSKAVLISINPKWCELIASGKKTVEIRKTKPKLETPFKCYIYCAKAKDKASVDGYTFFADELYIDCHSKTLTCGHTQFEEIVNGKVIGEFVCDKVAAFRVFENGTVQDFFFEKLKRSCLSYDEIAEYIGRNKAGYSWHISNLVIYDKPKELREFKHCGVNYHFNPPITKPPQSWRYAESEVEKMNDNEIIKALERMSAEDSDGFSSDILNLINRQKAEIERLKAENESYKHLDTILHTALNVLTDEIKSEVIKEFAERLKERRGRNFPFTEAVSIFDINSLVREMTEDSNEN